MMTLSDDQPLTLRDLVVSNNALLGAHIREDEGRWASIDKQLAAISGRLWGLVIALFLLVLTGLAYLFLEIATPHGRALSWLIWKSAKFFGAT